MTLQGLQEIILKIILRDQFNKLTSVFLCLCPVIDHEFRHTTVKVAVDPRSNMLSGFAGYFDKVMKKFIINNKTDALQTDINLFFTINCQIARSRSLMRPRNFKFMCLSEY